MVARVTVEVAVRVPATKLEVVALVAVRLVKKPVTTERRLAKKLDEVALVVDALVAKKLVAVALVTVRAEIVVVARFVLPRAVKLPDVVALPLPSTRKLRFSTQLDPFQ